MSFDLKRILVNLKNRNWTPALSGLLKAIRWRGRMSVVALAMALYAWQDPAYVERCVREEYRAARRKALMRKLDALSVNSRGD